MLINWVLFDFNFDNLIENKHLRLSILLKSNVFGLEFTLLKHQLTKLFINPLIKLTEYSELKWLLTKSVKSLAVMVYFVIIIYSLTTLISNFFCQSFTLINFLFLHSSIWFQEVFYLIQYYVRNIVFLLNLLNWVISITHLIL